ncbi:MAG: hypothetical protein ABR955_07565 [Verrucomicrobiota bacterium]|jgi:hypothetical protein
MKIKPKKELKFGDLITAAPQDWGAGRAREMVRYESNARQMVFRGQPHFLISSAKERFV